MPIAEEPSQIRNTSVNIEPTLKGGIDALIMEFENEVATTAKQQGLRKAMVRSQLQCNSVIFIDLASLIVVAEVANGMPYSVYISLDGPKLLRLETAIDSAKWEFGLFNCFGIQLPRELLNMTLVDRSLKLKAIALEWVHSEKERVMRESRLIQINPVFGPASYTLRTDFCFVIGPFSERGTATYNSIIRPALVDSGLSCQRADEMFTNRAIMTDIWQSLCEARLIVADLTERNPNVFYELGIAHTLGKDTIMISARNEEKIPFDIAGIRQILFDDSAAGGTELRAALDNTIRSILNPILVS